MNTWTCQRRAYMVTCTPRRWCILPSWNVTWTVFLYKLPLLFFSSQICQPYALFLFIWVTIFLNFFNKDYQIYHSLIKYDNVTVELLCLLCTSFALVQKWKYLKKTLLIGLFLNFGDGYTCWLKEKKYYIDTFF